MKKSYFFLFSILLFTSVSAQNSTYKNQWGKVEYFELKDLPKSALSEVNLIFNKAKKENNSDQIIKTSLYKSKFALFLEEDAQLKIISDLKKEIRETDVPTSMILESILADLYWQYFQQNRYKFYNRTKTDQKVDPVDFRTWDLQTLFEEVHKHYQNSLENKKHLQSIPIRIYSEILTIKERSDIYRPTLYDFLTHRTFSFYKTNERNIQNPTYKFTVENPYLLKNNKLFLETELPSKDSLSQELNAIYLYKDLTSFHLKDKDPTALIDISLERLNFIKNHAVFTDEDNLYLTTLKELLEQYNSFSASTEISYKIAELYNNKANTYQPVTKTKNQFKRKEALKICEEAIKKFPNANGSEKCRVLIDQIKQEKLRISVENYISINTPSRLLISYRNINNLNFKVYKVDNQQKNQLENYSLDSTKIAFINQLKAEKQWTSNLKNEEDHQEHSTEVLLPALNSGRYLIVSYKNKTPEKNSLFTYQFIQVTNLSLIRINDTETEIWQVINRNTGKPVKNAKVHTKSSTRYANKERQIDHVFSSDKEGFIQFEKKNYNDVYFNINYKNDKAAFGNYYIYKNNRRDDQEEEILAKTFLFTDRSIYRPGQTVYFKGILIQTINNKSKVVANEEVTVTLYDVNQQELKELELTTNEYGSFSSEFILPSNGLTGDFMIEVDEGYTDSKFYDSITDFEMSETYISVEEYKRPKFETKFKPVKESFQLNDSITVNGEVISFSGAKISNAKVKYRVVRTEEFPIVYRYYNPYRYPSESQEITNGETTSNSEGNFKIHFKAIPNLKIKKELKPVFNYDIYADVTDINGETHSTETTVRVAYHLLETEIDIPKSIDKNITDTKISINSKNLNGEFVPVNGKLKIYQLSSPEQILRKRPWKAPDYPGFTKEEFRKLFPHDSYANGNNPETWEKGELVFEKEINTANTKEITLKNISNWKSGKYVIEFTCTDRLQQKIENEKRFDIFSNSKNEFTKEQLIQVTANKDSYKAGETAKVKFASAAKELFITVFIEKNHKTIKKKIIHLSNESKIISVPVTQNDTGGFAVIYHTAFHNSFTSGNLNIQVPFPNTDLMISTQTFRDKIQPGSEQQWSFTITGDQKDKVAAEILASMYDASLDQFKIHQWNFNPIKKFAYQSYNKATSRMSFGTTNLNVRNLNYYYYSGIKIQNYDQLNWFGFNFNNNKWVNQRYLNALVDKYTKPDIHSKDDKTKAKGFIYGVVSDESDVLPGVSVLVKGTNRGAQTDFDGGFKIKAKKGDVLIFSFVGMKTLELKIRKNNSYTIKMIASENSLDEVVATALEISKQKKSLGIEIVEEAEVVEDIFFALAGRAAGIEVFPTPGASDKILIRGLSSLDNDKALIIIDGVPFTNKNDLKLDKNDILSVKIIKGEQATTLYGSQATYGVVLITTKSGQEKLYKELNKVKARTNFKETAFFYPGLRTDKDGNISFNFTIPEALTRWKLQLQAHTKDLKTGYLQLNTITQEDLMVVPNLPRFLRENDTIIISTKITNLSDKKLNGMAQIQLTDAISGNDLSNESLLSSSENKDFSIDAKNSTTVNWKLFIPKEVQAVQYRIVAKAGDLSDGEQNILPVLSNRMLVTESMTMQIKGNEKKSFTLEKLKNNTSKTLTNQKLTLEITSNPVWYAIQAMPYLMEFPHQCSEQIFSRYYANTLAAYLMNFNPKIEQVFQQWSSSGALISNLEKNPELKSMIIQETPWLRDAQSETEQKKRIALLFDLNKMKNEQEKALNKLKQFQRSDGGFPWFSGGRYTNRNISQHIVIGFGKLNKIIKKEHQFSPDNYKDLVNKTIVYLDQEILKDYTSLLKRAKNTYKKDDEVKAYLMKNHTGNFQIQYLYMSSFFKDISLNQEYSEAVNYYKKQSYSYWTDYEIYSRGLIAITAKRNGDQKIATEIYRSLEERSITSVETGMYWKENQPSWYWYQSPIQTQSLMIEVFNEFGATDATMDNLKLWLLKNKQTNSWKTTKATTNAIYAIMTTGFDWLAENKMVKVKVGEKNIDPLQLEDSKVEAGTGYFKTSWNTTDIKPEMAKITLEKESKGVAFGGLYWQYFEDLDKITSAETGIKISKELFLKRNTDEGIELYKIDKNTSLKSGDVVTVRIEIRSDREMEFVHLKDMRASGFEPVNTLSEYKYQDNLYYYESTKDAATNFFIDRLPKGLFVFEYDLRANNQGDFSNGITTMQSMYAPEFSSHSKGVRVKIN